MNRYSPFQNASNESSGGSSAQSGFADPSTRTGRSAPRGRSTIGSPDDHRIPFRVPVTVVELDADRKPAREFQGRTTQICRSELELFTRRMVYDGASVLIILPLLDDKPSVLSGIVSRCSYDANGEYRIVLEFSNAARSRFVEEWMKRKGYTWWKRSGGDEEAAGHSPSNPTKSAADAA